MKKRDKMDPDSHQDLPDGSQASFEGSLKRLEEIVRHLEEGDIPLDKSLKLFEEGIRLSRFCSSRIEQAKKRVEILIKESGGKLSKRPFDLEQPEESDEDE